MRAILLAALLCAAGCGDPATNEPPAEPTYRVVLTSYDRARRIVATKAVREETGLGLAESDRLIEEPPSVLVQGITKGAAEAMARRLAESGLVAEVRKD